MITYIIFTESRAAWLSIFIKLLFVILYFITSRTKILQLIDWNSNNRNASIFAVLMTLILINSNWYSFTDIALTIAATGGISDGASLQRFQIWQTALKMIYDAPFIGTGLGSYSQNLANEGYATWTINNTIRAHNDLLELAVELGLTGIIFFLQL